MTEYGPFFKRLCSHTAMAGFVLTWIIGVTKGVEPRVILMRSLVAATLFWMLGAFVARYAFGPPPVADVEAPDTDAEGSMDSNLMNKE